MNHDLSHALGFASGAALADFAERKKRLRQYINLQLIASGLPAAALGDVSEISADAEKLLASYCERLKLVEDARCPADRRIEAFLREHFADVAPAGGLRLPERALMLDRHGVARELSLPIDSDTFGNDLVQSYRVKNGVLHNPHNDRRTTVGTFHVVEGGLPIPADKKAVPKCVFALLFQHAFHPPDDLLILPFTANQRQPARTFVSLLLRPIVCPVVPGVVSEKRMEIRFFAPGGLVSNLDFVESIFGNAGDAFLPENDAGLDVEHWTGHTGAVILAPHLTAATKRELGLPHVSEATDRQKRDGMCWEDEAERYNDGVPFKLTCRTDAGVIVTLIADNYFGYCKKEVKTQISYAANLYGNVEEEHAGGAVAFPSYNLGDEFEADSLRYNGRTFADVARDYASFIRVRAEGYGIDRNHPDLIYIPEEARASLHEQQVTWTKDGRQHSIPLLPGKVYMTPSGYKLRMEKHPETPTWRLIGTVGEGTFCHKPCTVSGGGKSEISKSLVDYMLYGPIFVANLEHDLEVVEEIFDKDYSTRHHPDLPQRPAYAARPSRKVLDPNRTLGSVIKLLTPSPDYNEEYNAWLHSIPSYIYALVFIIKRFQKPEWSDDWRRHFSVDIVNGSPGNELKYRDRKLAGTYLRVGLDASLAWRTFKLRQDFAAAEKIQTEDDISASVVVPAHALAHLNPLYQAVSYKFVANCEYRLFQRPDEAVHRGLDRQTEADLARPDNFISNFEPISCEQVDEMAQYVVDLEKFTEPMKRLLRSVIDDGSGYVACSSAPRLVDGKPSQNPRYLQDRPDMVRPINRYVAEMGTRLFRAIPADKAVLQPVNAVLLGRRNNPPDRTRGIRSLAVYNPIHYQELPELFMDFICSLTGKSPSTTAAGSEGALTKGPFNALLPIIDLNNALVSMILTGLAGFSTAAGHIGSQVRVDHDLSLLVPEIWCRLTPSERDPAQLIREGLLEPLSDFDHGGERVLVSRLGYRITQRFVHLYFGRVFDNPAKVFDDAILRPETQDLDAFADGVKYITEAHERVAKRYFDDGSFEMACPPLQALLKIMAAGDGSAGDIHDASLRRMFTRDYLLQSAWYRERLKTKQDRDIALWKRHIDYLDQFIAQHGSSRVSGSLDLAQRRQRADAELSRVRSSRYLDELLGALGADPMQLSPDDVPLATPTRQSIATARPAMSSLDAERVTAGRI
ncbi:MAG TPA: hypothetical protein VGY55_19605 [Pirellulales bacterium]|jgi:hypothetical protein|nr:hypothetical protein [Pirellulales bacterium]